MALPGALSSLVSTVRAQISNALPLIGLGLAMVVTAVWIGFLTYCFLKLI